MTPINPQMFGTTPNQSGLTGLAGPLGGMPSQPVNMAGGDTYQMPSIYETDSFGAAGADPSKYPSPTALNQTANTTANQTVANPTANADQITGLYQNLLGRAPDQAGLQYWQSQLAAGKSIEDITNAFKSTPEYQQRQQAPKNPFGINTPNQFAASTDPYIQAAQQTTLGNLASAQQAVAANRVNQVTPYSNLQYEQTGTDANGNPIWTARQTVAPQLQPALSGLQSRVAQTAGQAFNPQTPSVGINPGETYSDAIMRRLQPQIERQNTALDAQLANQGIMPGSEAYNRAKTLQAQRQNDLLTAAQVGGINVGLQANQQGFNQALQQYNLPLTQLGAFQQATQPGYINAPAQATVAGPDYLGAYTTGQAAQIAARNAEAARKANLQSGLFGLGGTALLSSGGLPGLLNIGKGLANSDLINSIGNSSIFGSGFATPTMSGSDVLTERIFNLI